MAVTYRSLTKPRDDFYLIYFDTDDTVSVVKKTAVVEQCLEVGDYCQVKVQKKVFKGRVVSYGTKDDVVSLEEQFLAGVYTPDFLPPPSSDEETGVAVDQSVFLNSTPENEAACVLLSSTPINKEKSKKRKSVQSNVKEKAEKKAKRKKVIEKQSTITLLAISDQKPSAVDGITQ